MKIKTLETITNIIFTILIVELLGIICVAALNSHMRVINQQIVPIIIIPTIVVGIIGIISVYKLSKAEKRSKAPKKPEHSFKECLTFAVKITCIPIPITLALALITKALKLNYKPYLSASIDISLGILLGIVLIVSMEKVISTLKRKVSRGGEMK